MGIADDLDRLDELHRRGVLTSSEFERAKARVLGDGARPRAPSALNALRRSRDDAWFGGVCGGLANFTGVAAWLWRLAFVALALCGGTGIVAYLLLWFFVPRQEEPSGFDAGPMHPA